MRLVVALGVLTVLGLAAWVRLAPSDAAAWHVDPVRAGPPGAGGWKAGEAPADAEGPVFAAPPRAVLEAVEAVAADTPRTARLAGSAAEGRITYVTRSRLWGFPDYTTVAATPAEGGTRLTVLARLRFGSSDMGVNRARVEDWSRQVAERLDPSSGT
ncbi:DUF1499 domain-containing protein [Histidinibacterium lentulum]|uniref:DUF1499 domain-containing protein n=1 Tax=Histidinibacterium lentulum TaxID=2480588 RepID=A0A3N2QTA9_9RHOB|nr:DUF1499 domain-containing protein [Histidinibacterium lentulum]ROT98462.1 DUF1499 domain-containing protein [Histidinibacterium lentulum]